MWNKIKGLFKLSQREYACNVYRTAVEYKIITESKTNTGLFMEDEPIFIISISSPEQEICDKIFTSLKSSRENIKFPETKEEMRERQEVHLKNIKEKSYLGLYKNSTSCSIRLIGNIITITPYIFNKRWLEPVKEKALKIEYDNNELEITRKIIEILE